MRYAPVLLAFLAVGLVACDNVQEPTNVTADTQKLLCLEPITCENGDCELGTAVESPADCTDGVFARLQTTGFVSVDVAKKATVSEAGLALLEYLGIVPSVALAQSNNDLYFGIREGKNMSGPGNPQKCESKLHPCFRGGHLDEVLQYVNTEIECSIKCNNIDTPSQMACSYDTCFSRCVAARVNFDDNCS